MQQPVLVAILLSLLVIGTTLNLLQNGEVSLPTISTHYDITGAYTTAHVRHVVDGDTIELTNGDIVRYIGMNAPEVEGDNTLSECYGKEAKQANGNLVEGKIVKLVKDREERDVYGRLLRYVFIDSVFVEEELLRLGYARVLTIFPNTKFSETLEKAQLDAQNKKRGIWKTCERIFVDK